MMDCRFALVQNNYCSPWDLGVCLQFMPHFALPMISISSSYRKCFGFWSLSFPYWLGLSLFSWPDTIHMITLALMIIGSSQNFEVFSTSVVDVSAGLVHFILFFYMTGTVWRLNLFSLTYTPFVVLIGWLVCLLFGLNPFSQDFNIFPGQSWCHRLSYLCQYLDFLTACYLFSVK